MLQEVQESLEAEFPLIGLIKTGRRPDVPEAWHACSRSTIIEILPPFNLT
ncbi:hypothetical protein [Paraburkholderia aromaticivorans]|nr:hypothetical protein [Paraburkholderia aromaticivorans]